MIGNFSCSCLHLYISSVSVRAKGVNTLGISPSKCVETNVLLVLMNMLGCLHMKQLLWSICYFYNVAMSFRI